MKTLILAATSVLAEVPVCQTQWRSSFTVDGDSEPKGKYELGALGIPDGKSSPTGIKEDEGVFESAVYACVACFNELSNTKSCGAILGSTCHAYDVMTGFGTHEVEQVEAGADAKSMKTIEDSKQQQWTYVVEAGKGVPEGSQHCGPIVYRARNPKATRQVVDAACSRGDAFCEEKKNEFEDCCTGLVPENELCSDGKYCCGKENTVTIGKTVEEAKALCDTTGTQG